MEACASSPFCYTICVCLKCNLSNYKYTIFWIKVNRIVTKKTDRLSYPNNNRKNNSLRHLSFYKMFVMEYNTNIEPI